MTEQEQRKTASELEQFWEEHIRHEFSTRSTEDTLRTMVEDARARGASDQEIDGALFRIGCTRITRRFGITVVYYDDRGVERFIVLSAR